MEDRRKLRGIEKMENIEHPTWNIQFSRGGGTMMSLLTPGG
jgi:hypothetical protein